MLIDPVIASSSKGLIPTPNIVGIKFEYRHLFILSDILSSINENNIAKMKKTLKCKVLSLIFIV